MRRESKFRRWWRLHGKALEQVFVSKYVASCAWRAGYRAGKRAQP